MAPTLKAESRRPAVRPPAESPQGAAVDSAPSVPLPDPFTLYRGGRLSGARIAYESWGRLNAARDNAILLFTGLSPSAHAAATAADPSPGWWQRMIGTSLAIDTSRYFLMCVNSLGSCFGSTGPASLNPARPLAEPPGTIFRTWRSLICPRGNLRPRVRSALSASRW